MLQKTLPDEWKPPTLEYEIRDYSAKHNHLKVLFNRNKEVFKYDLIEISIGKNSCIISRDDLAHVITNGQSVTEQAVEDAGGGEQY